ncbi:hypothetical protein G7Z17_g9312 [Cylindrodendrum hubeiense]|uniref:Uncharacterized protein n=1 Tax=Cylindrodendrum hubeiense TaxID=595255 RepID=A0A9P5GZR0_9HYPO|nr:hypothetical protein G7Z17_g9312 [Cylindrodendrum hubeiense]
MFSQTLANLLSLKPPHPPEQLCAVDASKSGALLVLAVGGQAEQDQRKEARSQVSSPLGGVVAGVGVGGAATEAAVGVLQAEDPAADGGTVGRCERRGEKVQRRNGEAGEGEAG